MSEPNTNPAQDPATNPAQQGPTPGTEKTFTQSELDAAIGKRVAIATRSMPDESELTAFRAWKSAQPKDPATPAPAKDFSAELSAAQAEVENYKRTNYLLNKGITGDEAEFYAFKAGKLVSDDKTFEQAVDDLIKDRKGVAVSFQAQTGGAAATKNSNEQMNALIRSAKG